MTNEDDAQRAGAQGAKDADSSDATESKRPADTLAEDKTCPECGEPVDDVRATCINCGYEYTDDDHEDPEAGTEFVTGSQIDDEGNEMPDAEPPPEPEGSPQES